MYRRNSILLLQAVLCVLASSVQAAPTSVQAAPTSVQAAPTSVQAAPTSVSVQAAPVSAPQGGSISGGQASATIPFQYLQKRIYVNVRINGQGPFLALVDTGGSAAVDTTFAAHLHLQTKDLGTARGADDTFHVGQTSVESLQVGDITLNQHLLYVFPPVGDVTKSYVTIGYELFKQFVVGVDYDHHLITLTLPDRYHAPESAKPILLRFERRLPEIEGTIDGYSGLFGIDTGSGNSIDLTSPFVAKNHLTHRYPRHVRAVVGDGFSGSTTYGLVTRIKTLTLGRVAVHGMVTNLPMTKVGLLADPQLAGTLGGGVLQQFNLTFDYHRQKIYFVPNRSYGQRDAFNRSGLVLAPKGTAWQVLDVLSGSPAMKSGLKAGDQITAIDGRTAASPLDLRGFWRRAVGTRVSLVVQSGPKRRTVTLTLRDII